MAFQAAAATADPVAAEVAKRIQDVTE
jgi:hypothetical protein